jgi:hypothetical protein
MDRETRQAVTAAGGRGRAAALTPDERAAIAAAGARAVNSPAGLARRIVKAWPGLSAEEQDEVRTILTPVIERTAGAAEQV